MHHGGRLCVHSIQHNFSRLTLAATYKLTITIQSICQVSAGAAHHIAITTTVHQQNIPNG